ncbi:MAG TPA: DNA translocase FtsK [Clostridiales bacterium]|nr:DNA translocase FtsK [Clostridiales bacterium]
MASKQNRKKSSNTRKKRTNRQAQARVRENGAIQDEIILIIALVISILLFLSNLDLSGIVGKYISSFFFGMIGLETYIFPFILFFLTAFYLSNLGNRRALTKIISAVVFFLALAAFIELLTNPYDGERKFFDYFLKAKEHRNGGGLFGGIFVIIFCKLFEELATYIILIAMMVISVVVISGKAILSYIAKKSKASLNERMEYQRLRKEQLEAEAGAGDTGRRPPKTFILDKSVQDVPAGVKAPLSLQNSKGAFAGQEEGTEPKGRKMKKQRGVEEEALPVLDFHHLFEEEKEPASEKQEAVTTYEEELRNKFGHASQNEDVQELVMPEMAQEAIPEAQRPSQAEGIPEAGTTQVERKQQSREDGSTGVEKLEISQETQQKEYVFPSPKLLNAPRNRNGKGGMTEKDLKDTAMKLQTTLDSFGVHVTVTNASVGPAVTRYELQPEQGVKVSRITSLADDIKLNLAATEIRIEAPIPGKAAVGIEVPNKENTMVFFRELIESREFTESKSNIAFAVGKDIGGQTVVADIAKMPHMLIAGATGSGKSVCINTLIMSILYRSKPSDVRLIMVDPKVVELNVYNGIPHLLIPVVTDPKKASAALNWAVVEMTERYKKFADVGAKDLKSYNDKAAKVEHLQDESVQKLPQIVIIIDELADLMMVAPGEVEDAICRLAQLARAAGIHLVIATQRPSVNVITGLIKANVPSRIAFAVSSQIDSRTILDGSGAEKLLGKGDMLFFPAGYPKPVRIQGAFVSEKEVAAVVDFLKQNNTQANYSDDIHEKINNASSGEAATQGGGDDRDEYFAEAGKFIIDKDKASIGMLQRVYKIGFNRAARIMDQLAEAGVVGPEEGTKPRKVLMSLEQFEQYLEEY